MIFLFGAFYNSSLSFAAKKKQHVFLMHSGAVWIASESVILSLKEDSAT